MAIKKVTPFQKITGDEKSIRGSILYFFLISFATMLTVNTSYANHSLKLINANPVVTSQTTQLTRDAFDNTAYQTLTQNGGATSDPYNTPLHSRYDSGLLATKTNQQSGLVTTFTYDQHLKVKTMSLMDGRKSLSDRDPLGRLVMSCIGNSSTKSCSDNSATHRVIYSYYDSGINNNKLKSVSADLASWGNDASSVFANKNGDTTISYNYDNGGKLSSIIYPDGKAINYFYSQERYPKLINMQDANGRITNYNYNAQNQLTSATLSSPDNSKDQSVVSFEYYQSGRLKSVSRTHNDNTIANSAYAYDSMGALNYIQHQNKNGVLSNWQYTRDDHGRIITELGGLMSQNAVAVENNNYTKTYTYDGADRLVTYSKTEGNNSDLNQNYFFQSNLNLVQVSDSATNETINRVFGKNNELISRGKTSFQYDAMGNMTQDDVGNQYQFNGTNQLVKVTQSNGSEINFQYYANGMRALKSGGGDSGYIQYYYDESGHLLSDIAQDGNASYFIANGTQGRVISTGNQENTIFYLRDGLDSVLQMVSDSQQDDMAYDPFGQIQTTLNKNISINNHPLLYRGYYYDPEVNLYFLQARYYSPDFKVFISRDSVDDPGNSGNRYAYAGGNSMMNIDPYGHSWHSFISGVGNWFKQNWIPLIANIAGMIATYGFSIAASGAITSMFLSTEEIVDSVVNAASVSANATTWSIAGAVGQLAQSGVADGIQHQHYFTSGLGDAVLASATSLGVGSVVGDISINLAETGVSYFLNMHAPELGNKVLANIISGAAYGTVDPLTDAALMHQSVSGKSLGMSIGESIGIFLLTFKITDYFAAQAQDKLFSNLLDEAAEVKPLLDKQKITLETQSGKLEALKTNLKAFYGEDTAYQKLLEKPSADIQSKINTLKKGIDYYDSLVKRIRDRGNYGFVLENAE